MDFDNRNLSIRYYAWYLYIRHIQMKKGENMTVIAKNMNMPKSCYECPFNRSEYGVEYYEKAYCILTKEGMTKGHYKKRPSTCPLEKAD